MTSTTRIITTAFLFAFAIYSAPAQVPGILNYQGRVTVGGTNYNGTGQFKFALVNGGTNLNRQATGLAQRINTFIWGVAITDGGVGYSSVPDVQIVGGGGGGAQAIATVSNGVVTWVTVYNAGTNYTSDPTVIIGPPQDNTVYETFWSNDGSSANGMPPATAVPVTSANGLFAALLGSGSDMVPVPASVFSNTNVNLRVWFSAGGTNPFVHLTPDQRIGAVGYALRAAVADNVAATNITGDFAVTGTLRVGKLIGGSNNTSSVNGTGAVIAGGEYNMANFPYATIGGGQGNEARANTTIAGGIANTARGDSAAISGGNLNYANGDYSFVGGGFNNTNGAAYAVLVGGNGNTNAGEAAFLGGGRSNTITLSASNAVIGGGQSNTASDNYATIGGGQSNTASDNYATIGGGYQNTGSGYIATIGGGYLNTSSGDYATIGGGYQNTNSGTAATIGGGAQNTGSGDSATIGGGAENTGSGYYATIGGGYQNTNSGAMATIGGGLGNTGSGNYATIGGGRENTNSGSRATIGGGYLNTSSGDYATIGGGYTNVASAYAATIPGGVFSKATNSGSFVWSGDGSEETTSWGNNTFTIRAEGGVRFYTANGTGTGVSLAGGSGTWTTLSDRNAKENFEQVDGTAILAKVAAMPVMTWNYKTQKDGIRHIGPMAQDFKKAFGIGETDTGITTVDADGVALAAIQGLVEELKARDKTIEQLKAKSAEVDVLKSELRALRDQVQSALPPAP